MKPKINQQTCIGCGTCEGICSDVFKLNDGTATVVKLDDYTPFKDKIDQAVNSCPVQCITIEM